MLFWPYTGAGILVQTLDEGSYEQRAVEIPPVSCCQGGGPYVLLFVGYRPQRAMEVVVVREKE